MQLLTRFRPAYTGLLFRRPNDQGTIRHAQVSLVLQTELIKNGRWNDYPFGITYAPYRDFHGST
jgi:hypothetical protein